VTLTRRTFDAQDADQAPPVLLVPACDYGPRARSVTFVAMTGTGYVGSHFQMAESFDEAGVLCVSLIGELDIAVADALATRLRELQEQGREVRLDLSQLEFIDSTGLRELMCALDSSRREGSRLTVGTDMTRAVRRVVELVGVGPSFRPDGE
jgi:anti-sigma B factor antagonist